MQAREKHCVHPFPDLFLRLRLLVCSLFLSSCSASMCVNVCCIFRFQRALAPDLFGLCVQPNLDPQDSFFHTPTRTHTNSLTHTHKNSWQPGHIHIQILLHLHTQTHMCTLICTATLYLQNTHTHRHTHTHTPNRSVRDCGTHPKIGM